MAPDKPSNWSCGFWLSILVLPCAAAAAPPLRICIDTNLWYPFTFVAENRAAGLHVDIVSAALERVDFTAQFTPLPWKRCLHEARLGSVDAIVTAAYREERDRFLHYPPDASDTPISRWRVTQVEYVVMNLADSPYEFTGDLRSIPPPARAPYGYSIADDLAASGIRLDLAPGDENNVRKLLRDREGVVVTIPQMASLLLKRPEYAGKLKVSKQPIKSKSYFLAFSRQGRVAPADRVAIWEAVALVRDDEDQMDQFSQHYVKGPAAENRHP